MLYDPFAEGREVFGVAGVHRPTPRPPIYALGAGPLLHKLRFEGQCYTPDLRLYCNRYFSLSLKQL